MRNPWIGVGALGWLMAVGQPARSQPAEDEVAIERPRRVGDGEAVTVDREWTADRVTGAPVPGQESGRVDAVDPGDSTPRLVARAVLFVPRALFEVVFAPVRGGVFVMDRYKLDERFIRWFENDERTLGLMPWVRYDSDLGLTAGARFMWQLPGGERIGAFAGTGIRYQQLDLSVQSRELADRVTLGLAGEFRYRPRAAFYGIGNGDEIETMSPEAPLVDPLVDETAVETRFLKRTARASLAADVRLVDQAYARGVVAYSDIGVAEGPSDDLMLDEVYVRDALVGVDDYRFGYAELEVRWDTRRRGSIWEPHGVSSTGSLVSAFAGAVAIRDGARFWRYGGNLQHFVRLAAGPHAIGARLHGEAVTASLDEIPFTELPMLGGSRLLRGYPYERFRDRVAIAGTLEYQWDLSRYVFASLFVDVGRVYPEISEISFDDLRAGYGLAIEAHRNRGFLARASIASSIDGDLFVNLYFEPVTRIPRREERR